MRNTFKSRICGENIPVSILNVIYSSASTIHTRNWLFAQLKRHDKIYDYASILFAIMIKYKSVYS